MGRGKIAWISAGFISPCSQRIRMTSNSPAVKRGIKNSFLHVFQGPLTDLQIILHISQPLVKREMQKILHVKNFVQIYPGGRAILPYFKIPPRCFIDRAC